MALELVYGKSDKAFYGVWVDAYKTRTDCLGTIAHLGRNNFNSYLYRTSDWDKLNSEMWYAITVGEYQTKGEAEKALAKAKELGYTDAYIKYTGNRK